MTTKNEIEIRAALYARLHKTERIVHRGRRSVAQGLLQAPDLLHAPHSFNSTSAAAEVFMALSQIRVMYGHLEGTAAKFARDPSGYLSLEAGIFARHGLDVSWDLVQGTEERYRRLENGAATISLVVGRASLQHFLSSRSTKILGCVMNSCPYYLLVHPGVIGWRDLKGKVIACREGPARNTPLAATLANIAQLDLGRDLTLALPQSDLDAFSALIGGSVQAALLPRPYGFLAEERGFKRISDWPDVVDDPLSITIETIEKLLKERGDDFTAFLAAHREGIRYMKSERTKTIQMLRDRFQHTPALAGKTFDEYLVCMDEQLMVDFGKFQQLLSQIAPDAAAGARQIATDWVMKGALSE
jgi:ABC-type nitrate/sulfonate/bicarbonate transport system substrate-binding protein